MRRLLACFVVASALGAPAIAAAASPADVSAAEALFREARVASRSGNHAVACPKFRESYRLDPTVGTLLNLADCEEQDGRLIAAVERFQEGLERLPPSDDRVPYVTSRIHALDERVPTITPKNGAGVRLLVDDHEVVATQKVDPGRHELHVVGTNRDEHLVITIKESERREIDLALPPPPPVVTAPTRDTSTAGLVVGGLGAGALIASGLMTALMFDAKSTADAHCQSSSCDQAGLDATDAGKRYGIIGGATFVAGAAAVGIGAYLFLHGRSRREPVTVSLGPSGIVLGGTL